jgi:hypothetical protein
MRRLDRRLMMQVIDAETPTKAAAAAAAQR